MLTAPKPMAHAHEQAHELSGRGWGSCPVVVGWEGSGVVVGVIQGAGAGYGIVT